VPEYFSSVLLLNARVFAAGPVKEAFTQRNITATYGARLTVLDEASVGAGAVGA
jgi:manganese/zinc/iron transport system ATP- binding protein